MHVDLPARRSSDRGAVRTASLGLIALLVLSAALAGCAGAKKTPQVIFATPTPEPTPTPSPTPEVTPSPTPTPVPTPTPAPTTGPCKGSSLTITLQPQGGQAWQGVTGHELATFQLQNTGSIPCLISIKSQPLLLNGDGSILISGLNVGSSSSLLVQPNGTLKSTVQTGNLCAAPPLVAPVTVAFVLGGTGLVYAAAASPSDMGGVPPCTGDNAVASGEILMTSWAP
jgi:hypothetical protein